jgi:hypothetical protein
MVALLTAGMLGCASGQDGGANTGGHAADGGTASSGGSPSKDGGAGGDGAVSPDGGQAGGSGAGGPGWLRANLLAMGDRANSVTTTLSTRFDNRWGAGRFQMRHLSGADHPTWPWMWQVATFTMTQGNTVTFPVLDTGPEPVGLQQLKVVALTREVDGSNAADIDVYLERGNCTGAVSASDISRDYKSMVRTGSSSGGQNMCVRLVPYHIPAGQSRLVHVIVYYSGDTSMR